jgi:hypothetical protein
MFFLPWTYIHITQAIDEHRHLARPDWWLVRYQPENGPGQLAYTFLAYALFNLVMIQKLLLLPFKYPGGND